ncbi:hypothetical protein MPLB_2160004 [Mesorhizobium sp. ORS 3324]|nr:hypothetical protein MPLB_2160004 [Mesorhizobium sp. ORS 3324]
MKFARLSGIPWTLREMTGFCRGPPMGTEGGFRNGAARDEKGLMRTAGETGIETGTGGRSRRRSNRGSQAEGSYLRRAA